MICRYCGTPLVDCGQVIHYWLAQTEHTEKLWVCPNCGSDVRLMEEGEV